MVTVEINVAKFAAKMGRALSNMRNINKLLEAGVRDLGDRGYKFLKTIVPVSSLNKPHLRDSFKMTITRGPSSVKLNIASNMFYADWVNSGVSVPTRTVRSKKTMRFTTNKGDLVFAPLVRGFKTTGVKFYEKTEKWLMVNAQKIIEDYIMKSLKELR